MPVHPPPEHPRGPSTPDDSDATPPLRPRGRRPRWWVTVPAVAILGGLAVGAAELDADEGRALGDTTRSSTGNGGMVTEFSPADRGSPVRLSGTTLEGTAFSLETLRGEIVVINVWGSWCPPCREEAPVLANAAKSYADKGVSFLGINVRDNRAAAVGFERRYGIAYPSLDDSGGRSLLALNQYVPANAVPVTLVLDRQGRVASRILGAITQPTLTALLNTALAETNPHAAQEPRPPQGR